MAGKNNKKKNIRGFEANKPNSKAREDKIEVEGKVIDVVKAETT